VGDFEGVDEIGLTGLAFLAGVHAEGKLVGGSERGRIFPRVGAFELIEEGLEELFEDGFNGDRKGLPARGQVLRLIRQLGRLAHRM